jgi:hypothetical protein
MSPKEELRWIGGMGPDFFQSFFTNTISIQWVDVGVDGRHGACCFLNFMGAIAMDARDGA